MAQDKLELFDYLTNTLSLEILEKQSKKEESLFSDYNSKEPAKYLVVKAAKKHSEQRHFNKWIKLDLVDHSKN